MNKTALVTGASQGIGEAIARRLAQGGFTVGLVARGRERLERLRDELRLAGHRAFAYPCDVGQRGAVSRVVAQAEADMDGVFAVINNAGWGGPFHKAHEVDEEEWRRVFAVNLEGVRYFCEILLPAMEKRGGGRVVNIASIMGLFGGAGSSTYAASKHALIGYTRSIAAEWGAAGITCNAVCPGYIATTMTEEGYYDEEKRREVTRPIPAGRLGRPEEVAAFVGFLVTREAAYCNGGVYVIDGGLSARLT